jgi:capsular polysaccharide transport system ATP-binding protein
MIEIKNLTKVYSTRSGSRAVLNNVSMRIVKGERLGILGCNGAGKSTLIRLISGIERPTFGSIHRGISISWPLAFGGAFQGSLTGVDNIRFICRVYGVPSEPAISYVEEFSELGVYLREPVKKYSSGMRARLAFGISMAVEFDCFLIDEIVAVGDDRFQEKSRIELFEKRKDRAMIIVSHNTEFIRKHCNHAAVLVDGVLHDFENVDDAFHFYHANEV